MTVIATVIPITKQSAPFTREPGGIGVSLMVVEDMNGLEVGGQYLENKCHNQKLLFTMKFFQVLYLICAKLTNFLNPETVIRYSLMEVTVADPFPSALLGRISMAYSSPEWTSLSVSVVSLVMVELNILEMMLLTVMK